MAEGWDNYTDVVHEPGKSALDAPDPGVETPTATPPRRSGVKAAVYYETGGPEVFRYEDVPDPVVYPGGVLIEVEAISIEGGDTLNRAGGEMATTPHVVGYQCAGNDPRGRRRGRGPLRRPAGGRHDAVGLARRARRSRRPS